MQQEGNIYNQLSAIDLNAGVKVTVTFEDSDDEDSKRCLNKVQSPLTQNQTPKPCMLMNDYHGDAGASVHPPNMEIRHPDNISIDSAAPVSDRQIQKHETQSLDHLTLNNGATDNQNLPNPSHRVNSRKRKSDETAYCTQSKSENTQNIEMPPVEEKDILLKDLLQRPRPEKSRPKAEAIGSEKAPIPDPSDKSGYNNCSSNQHTDPNVIKKCYKNLLRSVSEHLVEIRQMYDYYRNYIKNKKKLSQNEIDQIWDACRRKKYRLYSLSYSTVFNVILPQYQNEAFLIQLINDTYNLMIMKGVKGSHLQLHNQIKDIIKYTLDESSKNGKANATMSKELFRQVTPAAETVSHSQTQEITDKMKPEYSYESNFPSQNMTTIHANNKSNNTFGVKTSLACDIRNSNLPNAGYQNSTNSTKQIFSSGPPGRQLSINVDPGVLAHQNNEQVNTAQFNYSSSAPPTCQNAHQQHSVPNSYGNLSPVKVPQSNVVHHRPKTQQQPPLYMPNYGIQPNRRPPPAYPDKPAFIQPQLPITAITNMPSQIAYEPNKISQLNQNASQPGQIAHQPNQFTSQLNQITLQPNQIAYQPSQIAQQPSQIAYQPNQIASQLYQIAYQPIQIAYQPSQIAQQPSQIAYQPNQISQLNQNASQPGQIAHLPSQIAYQPSQIAYQPNQISQLNQIASQQGQIAHQPSQIEDTRSISTDSGFMSPVNFSSSPAPMNDGAKAATESPFPLITHVTSYNPNAVKMPEGLCSVCKSVTKKKCLGCLGLYYCSLTCQKADWALHMLVCRSQYPKED